MHTMKHPDSFSARKTLDVGGTRYTIFRLDSLRDLSRGNVDRLPFSLKILLENLLRGEDEAFVKTADIETLAHWNVKHPVEKEIAFRTSRVLLQDARNAGEVLHQSSAAAGLHRRSLRG